ncbi:hypothetical protein BTO30_02925 [Domibacillus antri]|uniref:HTH cro/C1-type domain-containing protein n=1 Tax=Domibacillus antri TaxID=1714264 RepID=A0A1Q8Q8N8_9BACI|nr:helix-turn-helix transcriptional regulator [Domibacillus antri]OLN23706.1 hypothetical protein BTO30_02925 [Domibacillus antri]
MRIKSNLKTILDERKMSIRELERKTGLKFETLRRLYNDTTVQYHRDALGKVCTVLNIRICELLVLVDEDVEEEIHM